ncbi:hypothetical protein VV01_15165 [Luteipulveratus halotolerans]|uniref:Phosphogluconate dehydrogenase NAD-binding putative C-terminal domain-containing protein n=2 Tax=Luteipulveratus halotolerans TaxID=1631356 RepID=A0A0L6CP57_9MICO|nr:hypothetical protein VV01_15165 [Luteipulveratus halotolerans]
MGAAVGAALVRGGVEVVWASAGRSEATRARADEAGLVDLGTVAALVEHAHVVVSVCPPHAAFETATQAAAFTGIYVDANAVSPGTVRRVAAAVPHARFVDGALIGSPPVNGGGTRIYLSGDGSGLVAELFAGTALEARVVEGGIGSASALKMAYAAWTKGAGALLLTARELARAEGVEDDLLAEWAHSLPQLGDQVVSAERSAATKGWRWVGEMDEIAMAMRETGLPDGFHRAAAQTYAHYPRPRH